MMRLAIGLYPLFPVGLQALRSFSGVEVCQRYRCREFRALPAPLEGKEAMRMTLPSPTRDMEADLLGRGYTHVIGVDEVGRATLEAMRTATTGLLLTLGEGARPYVLVDGKDFPHGMGEGEAIIKGDATVHAIAGASVLAKVTRDQLMMLYAKRWPGYGFEKHKGYGTRAHMQALMELGATPIHRWSFEPLKGAVKKQE